MKKELRFAEYDGLDQSPNPIHMLQSLIFQVANGYHIPKRFRKTVWTMYEREAYITELNWYLTNAKMRASLN